MRSSFTQLCMLLFLLQWTTVSFGAEVRALVESDQEVVYVGDVKKLKLTIWPVDNEDAGVINRLDEIDFGDSLHVLNVEDVSFSANNEEALEVALYAVFTSDSGISSLRVAELEAPVEIRSLEIRNEVEQQQELSFFKEVAPESSYPKVIFWFVISLIILVFMIWLVWLLRKKRRLLKRHESLEYWRKKILASTERLQIEDVYLRRDEWKPFCTNLKKHDEFCSLMDAIQYRRGWTSQEVEQARKVLKDLEESIH